MPGTWLRKAKGVCSLTTATTTTTTERVRTLSSSGAIRNNLSPLSVQRIPLKSQSKTVAVSRNLPNSCSTDFAHVRELSCRVSLNRQSTNPATNERTIRTHPGEDESGTGQHQHEPPSTKTKGTVAPSPPQGHLSIVFTDIVKSTSIWEAHASAMTEAMQTHDNMVRELVSVNEGYEVKQNGDGFMIAFPSATSAVQFCLDVQERLLDESWPAAILKSPPGKETTDEHGHVLFRGLKLRMSAHWGEPVCNWNDVIQRMDYLGPMVNRAARFIEATEGGQVVVSEDFLLQLQCELELAKGKEIGKEGEGSTRNPEELDLGLLRSDRDQKNLTHQPFRLRLLGDHEFKGLNEPQKLYFIVPKSLEGRVEHWHKVMHIAGVKGNVRMTQD